MLLIEFFKKYNIVFAEVKSLLKLIFESIFELNTPLSVPIDKKIGGKNGTLTIGWHIAKIMGAT